jgi:beta-mannosidase
VWTIDENLGGVVAHVANDGPAPLSASLRVALYRDREHRVGEARVSVELEPHSQGEWNVESVIGHFVDAAWAYKFGPPAQDAIVVTLEEHESDGVGSAGPGGVGASIISQAMRFPAGRPLEREPAERLGLAAQAQALGDGTVRLTLSSRRLAYGVEIHAPGFVASDDGFSIEPGGERVVMLRPSRTESHSEAESTVRDGRISAVNMSGRVRIDAVGR